MQNRLNQKTFGIIPAHFTSNDILYSTSEAKISDTLTENEEDVQKKETKCINF